MKYKMLVCDIDGTLLNSKGQLTPGVIQAVRDAHEAGVVVTLATGRHLRGVLDVIRELGVNVPVVLANGAVIVDPLKGETILHKPLPMDTVHAVLDVVRKHGLWSSIFTHAFEGVDSYYDIEPGFDEAYLFIHRDTPYVKQIDDLKSLTDIEPLKVLLVERPEKVKPLAADLQRLQETHDFQLIVSDHDFPGYTFLEVHDLTSTKAVGIDHLAQTLGISAQEVVTVGDNVNDLEMIEYAGLGTAMGNAAEVVKELADWVTKSNDEDGVAYLIREKILSKY